MTTGEWLASLSSAPQDSTALTVVANIEGTYPVLTPIDSFTTDMVQDTISADLDIISITADVIVDKFNADVTEELYTADITMENYDGNFN